jgi:agmatinase
MGINEGGAGMKHFLGSELKPASAKQGRFHVIPVPMQLRVSYGGGTHRGPDALLEASQHLEEDIYGYFPGDWGIHTQKPITVASQKPETWLNAIEAGTSKALAFGAIPVLLGGEHTVTLGAARAFHKAGQKIGFIHFGAHANLRNEYEETSLSPACVMRRVHELGFPLVQIATRAVSQEEQDYRAANKKTITAYDGLDIADGHMPSEFIPRGFPKEVFVTFDIDGLDPSIMPATRSPVVGGLCWYDVIRILRKVVSKHQIIGCDILELAPIKGLHHADLTAALLTQTLMAMAMESEEKRK